jgi:hypothetical protein
VVQFVWLSLGVLGGSILDSASLCVSAVNLVFLAALASWPFNLECSLGVLGGSILDSASLCVSAVSLVFLAALASWRFITAVNRDS